jgi:hypothetical protein
MRRKTMKEEDYEMSGLKVLNRLSMKCLTENQDQKEVRELARCIWGIAWTAEGTTSAKTLETACLECLKGSKPVCLKHEMVRDVGRQAIGRKITWVNGGIDVIIQSQETRTIRLP